MDKNIYATLSTLAALDDREFEIACSANPELQMICNGSFKPGHQKNFNHLTDFLYMTRFEYYFDKSLLEFKEPGMSWKEFVDRLTYLYKNINTHNLMVDVMALDGKLMELKILKRINKFPGQYGANWAAIKGHFHILEWMKENNLALPNQTAANWAAEQDKLSVLKWMKKNNLPFSHDDIKKIAAKNGNDKIFDWIMNPMSDITEDSISLPPL